MTRKKGICCKCKQKGARQTKIFDANTGKELHFRCGYVGFCEDCLEIVRKKNKDKYIYKYTTRKGTEKKA